MNTKAKNAAIVFSTLMIGYVAGSVFGLPPTIESHSKGDISKVSKFHRNSVENSASAYQQKLLSDTAAFNDASLTTQILSDKLSQFSELVELSVRVAGEIPELSKEVFALNGVYGLAENAEHAGDVAKASFDKLQSGNDNELAIDVEQASQNLILAYLFIDRQASLGKDFVTAADNYLKKNKDDEDLAVVRDLWVVFCAENAVIAGNDEELTYWGKQEIISSDLGTSVSKIQGISNLQEVGALKTKVQELGAVDHLQGISNLQGIGALKTKVQELGLIDRLQERSQLQTVAPAVQQYA